MAGGDRLVVTAEGRTVGTRSSGATDQLSLLYLHGSPGSRAEVGLFEPELLTEYGVGVVSFDRPGYGRTDPTEQPDFLAAVRDAVAVADSYSMDRFAILGSSGGGPYALAVAAQLPGRVTRVILAGGQPRLDTPWAYDGMDPEAIAGWQLTDQAEERRISDEAMAMAAAAPDKLQVWLDWMSDFPADELAFLRTRRDVMTEDLTEASRQGGVGDWLDAVRAQPWLFDVADIACPIHAFHGGADTWNPWPALRKDLEGARDLTEYVYAGGMHLAPWSTRERREAMLKAASGDT
jgi:pimeloyl-ACP methyl ester carboxylesterase